MKIISMFMIGGASGIARLLFPFPYSEIKVTGFPKTLVSSYQTIRRHITDHNNLTLPKFSYFSKT
jgi:hypothetical protein